MCNVLCMRRIMYSDMKKLMILVVMVAAFALPTMAQSAQEWQTSTLPGSGSNYAPQVTAVGATAVPSEATTTTANYSPGKSGAIRKGFLDPANPGNQSNESPVGDAVLPLLLLAAVYSVWCMVYKRKRA